MPTGRFVWFDLMTTDPDGARAFYASVMGWKTPVWEGGDPDQPYTLWAVGERAIGGVVGVEEGESPHWLTYIHVDDVDGAVSRVVELGGAVVRPAVDRPSVGRMAVVSDVDGAVFALFAPVSGECRTTPDPAEFGDVMWSELAAVDHTVTWAFYEALLGWETVAVNDMGGGWMYRMFKTPEDEKIWAGIYNRPPSSSESSWLHYVFVENLEAASQRVREGGGRVVHGPQEVPGGDVVLMCADPQGASFALVAKAATP